MIAILGVSTFYHDAGAALVKDGKLVAAAEEERFNRQKHYSDFPKLAIEYCLKEAGITIDDVDYIGFYEKPLVKFNRILETTLARWPLTYWNWVKSMPVWLVTKLRIGRTIQKELDTEKDIYYCQHHLAHAAKHLAGDNQARVHAGSLFVVQKLKHTTGDHIDAVHLTFILFGKNSPLAVVFDNCLFSNTPDILLRKKREMRHLGKVFKGFGVHRAPIAYGSRLIWLLWIDKSGGHDSTSYI